MTNRFARNWTSWCRTCEAYRRMARGNRSVCSLCGNLFAADPAEEAKADEREAEAIARLYRAVLAPQDDKQ